MISLLFGACEKIDPPYKEEGGGSGGEAVQKVLLEDYTGHDCVNCPTAAVVAKQLAELYGDRLVVMAVHAGFFARPKSDMPQDFRTEAGETWDGFFGVSAAGNPNGMVNRIQKSPGDYIVNVGEWGSTMATEMEKEAKAKMTLHSDFSQNTLTSTVTAEFQYSLEGTFNVLLCITQDSIIGPQKNNDPNVGEVPLIENYIFMHMLRYTNGAWGEQLTDDDPVVAGKEYEMTFTVDFEDEWVPEHCHVIAFVFNQETKTIIQVEESEVIE